MTAFIFSFAVLQQFIPGCCRVLKCHGPPGFIPRTHKTINPVLHQHIIQNLSLIIPLSPAAQFWLINYKSDNIHPFVSADNRLEVDNILRCKIWSRILPKIYEAGRPVGKKFWAYRLKFLSTLISQYDNLDYEQLTKWQLCQCLPCPHGNPAAKLLRYIPSVMLKGVLYSNLQANNCFTDPTNLQNSWFWMESCQCSVLPCISKWLEMEFSMFTLHNMIPADGIFHVYLVIYPASAGWNTK